MSRHPWDKESAVQKALREQPLAASDGPGFDGTSSTNPNTWEKAEDAWKWGHRPGIFQMKVHSLFP